MCHYVTNAIIVVQVKEYGHSINAYRYKRIPSIYFD